MDSIVESYCNHYLKERPHQGKDNDLLVKDRKSQRLSKQQLPCDDQISLADIHCHKRLGGLLKHYSRRAA